MYIQYMNIVDYSEKEVYELTVCVLFSTVYSQALKKLPDVEVPLPVKDKLGFDQVLY